MFKNFLPSFERYRCVMQYKQQYNFLLTREMIIEENILVLIRFSFFRVFSKKSRFD